MGRGLARIICYLPYYIRRRGRCCNQRLVYILSFLPFLSKGGGKVVAAVCLACALVIIMLYVKTQMEMLQSRESNQVQIRPTTPAYAGVGSIGNSSGVGEKLPRILCWVMVDPSQLKRATDVKETWASHCDMCLFMSSEQNNSFPTIGLDVPAGRDHIGAKSKAAWTYIYKHHIQDADYFVKTDPDTFLVVENLKEYMAHRNPDDPEFFGHRMYISAEGKEIIYNSGGPGQLLSRKAVEILVTKAFANKTSDCMKDGQGEDWKTGLCLAKHGARIVDTRDAQGRMTFMIFMLDTHMKNNPPQWYRDRIVDDVPKGYKCCSEYPIGFHYVSHLEMHKLYYYMYEMKHAGPVVTNLSDKEKFLFIKPDGHEKKTWYPA